jgi:hypothetical protein
LRSIWTLFYAPRLAKARLLERLDPNARAIGKARKLIDKILFHVGYDDADIWKVVITNDEDDAQMIVRFAVSQAVRSQRRGTT